MTAKVAGVAPVAGARSDAETVAKNSTTLLLRQAVLWGLNSILVLFLPRYLGAEGLGQVQFAISFAALFEVGITLGARQFLIKEIARDKSKSAYYLGTAIGTRVLTTTVVLLVILAVAQATVSSSTARAVVFVAAGTMVVTAFSRLLTGVLHGHEDMKSPAVSEVAGKLIVLVAAIPVLITGRGVVAYALVLLGGTLVNAALNLRAVRKVTPLRVDFNWLRARELVIGGLPFLFMAFVLEIYNHVDVVILRAFTTDTETGWYAAALQFYRAAEMFPLALTTALLPTLARLHAQGTPALAGIARKSIAISGLVVIPVALGLSFLSKDLISFLPYPATFDNSAVLLSILALTIPMTTFLTVLGTVAVAVDRQKVWAYALLFTLLLDIVLNMVFVPYFARVHGNGGIGAAITTLAAEAVMVIIGVRLLPRGVLDRALGVTFLKITVAAGAMVGAGFLASWLGTGVPLVIAFGAATYLATVLLTKAVTADDVSFLKDKLSGRFTRRRSAPPGRDDTP